MTDKTVKIKALILPKFELGEMTGDAVGEAQHYYDAYLKGGEEYDIAGCSNKLYVKDSVALLVTGMGKVNAALSVFAVLTDSRFDFSETIILSTGCGGAAYEYGVMGDVYVITACFDSDMGHTHDTTELSEPSATTWFYDASFEGNCFRLLNSELTEQIYDLVKDLPLKTTEKTENSMRKAFGGADWAIRKPKVLKGSTATGDNYWKGLLGHNNAVLKAKTYCCPDPYCMSEMEDFAIAMTLDRLGMLDRLVVIRGAVNMDVFMNGASPETLWRTAVIDSLPEEDSWEAADIFDTAMENIFRIGAAIVDAVVNNKGFFAQY